MKQAMTLNDKQLKVVLAHTAVDFHLELSRFSE